MKNLTRIVIVMSARCQRQIKAIVFDMDGVLIDAKDWHFKALNRSLKLFGLEISLQDHLNVYDGLPTLKKLDMLSTNYSLPSNLHKFINEMKQIYTMELVSSLCKPNFIHQYALSRLRERGYRLAVASNSIRKSVDTMLERSKLLNYLEFTISNEDVSEAKPNPEIYDRSIEKLGLTPGECLVVEDNHNGIKAATKAGAHLFIVKSVEDVSLKNILTRISEIESGL